MRIVTRQAMMARLLFASALLFLQAVGCADMQSHEVRVFDSEGRFLFRFGGQGEGPGEPTSPCCLAFGPDGALWVRESIRYSAFRIDAAGARYDRGLRIAHGAVGMVAPVTFDAAGRLVDIGALTSPEGEAVTARFHRGSDGSVDTIAMADPDRQATGSTTVSRTFRDMQMSFVVRQPRAPSWWLAIAGRQVFGWAVRPGSPHRFCMARHAIPSMSSA